MNIDWAEVRGESINAPELQPTTISRTQGLIWMFRNLGILDTDILASIEGIEDTAMRYEASKYFEAAVWEITNPYVEMIADQVGLDTPEKLKTAFYEAQQI